MKIANIETRRVFGVVAEGYETRINEDGEETAWLDSEVQAPTEHSACRRALEEWLEIWPNLALPSKVTFKVRFLVLSDGTEVDWLPKFKTVNIKD